MEIVRGRDCEFEGGKPFAMRAFRPYVSELEKLLRGRNVLSQSEWKKKCLQSLNGEPSRRLRKLVELDALRASGAFFTGSKLAGNAVGMLGQPADSKTVYFDPTCGAGDLLLAVARTLPLGKSLTDTLRQWGLHLAGCDTSMEFVRAAKARLALLAMNRCGISTGTDVDPAKSFPLIRRGNALSEENLFSVANRIIFNPPFNKVSASSNCKWAEGNVNAAAVFAEVVANRSRPGTEIVAILPDVLRSGTRYRRWRKMMEGLGRINDVCSHGLFDRWANVDVFLLATTAGKSALDERPQPWTPLVKRGVKRIGDIFDVRVGPVVPHRDKRSGREFRYIHARSLPAWGTVKRIGEKRRCKGVSFTPPFVAVRRTSSPSDTKRAVATIILGKQKVAVENHLIILLPKECTVTSCRRLVRQFRSNETDIWLNRRIRCRHLTVSALSEMPWWDEQ